jgi:hypothetical protein
MSDTVSGFTLNGNTIVAASWDGTMISIDAKGNASSLLNAPENLVFNKPTKDISKLPKASLIADLGIKQVLPGATATAVAYWGGTLQIFAADGTLKTQQRFAQDITALYWQEDTLFTGLAGGDIMALMVK